MNCQMFSWLLSSGARGGNGRSEILLGTFRSFAPTNSPARKGSRPRASHDQRTQSTYLFGAVCPQRGAGAALVLPACNTETMQLHLDGIDTKVTPGCWRSVSPALPRPLGTTDPLDQAGWHAAAGNMGYSGTRNAVAVPLSNAIHWWLSVPGGVTAHANGKVGLLRLTVPLARTGCGSIMRRNGSERAGDGLRLLAFGFAGDGEAASGATRDHRPGKRGLHRAAERAFAAMARITRVGSEVSAQ